MAEERRANNRLQMALPVLYKVSGHSAIHKAVTYDISDSGISLYINFRIHYVSISVTDSPKTCAVVWSAQKFRVLHKIGARFL